MTARRVAKTFRSKPTIEGAGVHLKRAFGYHQAPQFDPFLMLDDFHTSNPEEYLAGFPWHPHRGIETITYILEGLVEHGDSMGNRGSIGAGDVQWMTAGSGIIHQEMPQLSPTGTMWGFQFWANLPASHKMMAPRYQDIRAAEIPEVELEHGVLAKVIAGEVAGVKGPVRDIVTDPEMFDITVPSSTAFSLPVKDGYTVYAYLLAGAAWFDEEKQLLVESESAILYEQTGGWLAITTGEQSARFILLSGKPLNEPVAWQGPIVMNTREELRIAFEEYTAGSFIK